MKKRDRKRRHHRMVRGVMEIPASICDDPKCAFYGKRAAQGVCCDFQPDALSRYWDFVFEQGQELLREKKALRKANKHTTDKSWIKALEDQVICTWANYCGTLDELVYLRGENAKLRLRLGKYDSSAKPAEYSGPNERRVTKRNRQPS